MNNEEWMEREIEEIGAELSEKYGIDPEDVRNSHMGEIEEWLGNMANRIRRELSKGPLYLLGHLDHRSATYLSRITSWSPFYCLAPAMSDKELRKKERLARKIEHYWKENVR